MTAGTTGVHRWYYNCSHSSSATLRERVLNPIPAIKFKPEFEAVCVVALDLTVTACGSGTCKRARATPELGELLSAGPSCHSGWQWPGQSQRAASEKACRSLLPATRKILIRRLRVTG